MNNFTQRIITGAVLVSAVIASLLYSFYTFSALFFVFCLLGLTEFYQIATPRTRRFQYLPSIIAGAAIYLLTALTAAQIIHYKWLELVIPIAAYFFLFELYNLNTKKPFESIAIVILGIIYVALPFSLLNYLAFLPSNTYNYQIIMACFIFLWCSDSGAYLVGKAIGKTQTKLLKRISPKKTVEGFIGGVVLTIVVAYFLVSKYFTSLNVLNWMVISVIVSVAGAYGDLVESLLKRSFDKKDSGSVLPGHGGILDRFDSLILAAPLVYTYIKLL